MKNLVINKLVQTYTYGCTGVQELSMECAQGESVAVLAGREGGKTSLLKCIAGLYPASSGEILICGADVTNKPVKDRNVLLVHEDGGLFKFRTVFYNLAFPLIIRKVAKEAIKEKILSVASELGFQGLLYDKINTLTGGEKLKVMFARALLRQASVYLFDDIFKVAEPEDRQKLFSELLPLIKRLDGAVVFATSSADEAMSVAKNITILNYGYTVDEGSAEQIRTSPRCLTSYKFLHSYATNILTAKVVEGENGEAYIHLLGKRIALESKKLLNPIYIGGEVTVCFETQAGDIPFDDYYIEYYNNTPFMHCALCGENIITRLNGGILPQGLDIDLSSLKLFDVNSEKSVYSG